MASQLKKSSIFLKALLVGFILAAIYIGNVVFFPHTIPTKQYQLLIDKNQSLASLAATLEAQNIIHSKRAFLGLLRVLHKDKKVTAGLYIIKSPVSTWSLVSRITNGNPDQISVTLIDGWNFNQIREYINGLPNIQHLSQTMSQDELKSTLRIDLPNLEGVFFPSTYFVAPNQTDLEIYHQAYKLMQNKLSILFTKRSTSAFYTSPYQLLIIASLIEKETSNVEDMYLVSTVFNNRLKIGMKLQDDPAVFYGLAGKSKITRADFQINTPYNTYLHYGLPPTPICTPSEQALQAASQPLNKPDLLYFVAIGDGKTKFSSSYHEHRLAVTRYVRKPNPPIINGGHAKSGMALTRESKHPQANHQS